jgi:hypothetical protein
MIPDILEVMIQICSEDDDLKALTNGQIAARHRYGGGWEDDTNSLTIGLDGGSSDLYLPTSKFRLEVRGWGKDYEEALKIYRAFVENITQIQRREIHTVDGSVMIYYINLVTQPLQMLDPDIKYPFVLWYVEVMAR